MIYLIGGPARLGKSVLAASVRREIDCETLSTDALKATLTRNLNPAWVPDIFAHTAAPFEKMSSQTRQLDRLRRRDERLWQFCESYIDAALGATPHEDILIEGGIWPDFTSSLRHQHRAVFLVDTSPAEEQFGRLRTIRDDPDNDNNWMYQRRYTDRYLKKWAKFNLLRSQRYVRLCREFGYLYFDITPRGMQYAQDKAYAYLLQKTKK